MTAKDSESRPSDRTDWARVRALRDEDIAPDEDSPEMSDEEFEAALADGFVADGEDQWRRELARRR
ncbi:MAG: hypothetical protein H7A16_09545 [Sinobacteraceae bacterium]|nr:hypothetical protein [Nevskiaceae bacterium]